MLKQIAALFAFLFSFSTAYAQTSNAGMTPCGAGITLSATNSSSNAQLSACGSAAIIWNIGTTEAFLNLGTTNSTAATTSNWSIPAGSGVVINTGRAPLYIAAITASSTTTIRVVQGNGEAAIALGGGAGGGGGSAVTIADGADVTEGAIADAASSAGGVGTISAKLRLMTTQLGTINTTLGTPMQQTGGTVGLVAGVAEIGNVKNSGTFAVQATLSAETTKVIGTVNQGTSPWVTSGAVTVSSATAPVSTMNSASANTGTTAAVSGVFDDVSPTAISENSFGYMRMSANRNIYSTIRDAAGNERGVNVSAANEMQVGSGTLATSANQTTMATNQTVVQAPVAPATATATKANLIGCQATSAAINPTTGQQAAVDCDLNNNILVSSGGAPNLATSQVSVATSDTSVAAARALRRSITVQQVTGTQQVYCSQTTATTANGILLPAVIGASFTLNTTSAVRCIAVTGAQTVAIAETF